MRNKVVMFGRKLTAAVACGVVLLGAVACSSENQPTEASSGTAAPLSDGISSPPPESASTPTEGAGAAPSEVVPFPATTPEGVAQDFAELAVSNLAVLNAPDIDAAIEIVHPYLTDTMGQALRDASDQDAWLILPFRIPGAFGGGQPVAAQATTVSSTPLRLSEEGAVEVETVVEIVWNYDTQGEIYGKRKYTLTLVPGTEPDGSAWRIDGGRSADGTYSLTPSCAGLETAQACAAK